MRYFDLYPGVDLEISGENGRISPRLLAQPGADLSAVSMRVEGVEALTLDGNSIWLDTQLGEFTLPLLVVEGLNLERLNVEPAIVRYVNGEIFEVTAPFTTPDPKSKNRNLKSKIYNPQSITDNPADLLYGTFLGGDSSDFGFGIVVDGSGAAYVTGKTNSSHFPTKLGAFDATFNSDDDVFVAKVNPTGSSLDYGIFLGGGDYDGGNGIAVDGSGAAYITGYTYSNDFPTTPVAFDTTFNGVYLDAFVVKVNPTGNSLDYGTFLGGGDYDEGSGIAVDISGAAYITGYTWSNDFPTTPAGFDTTINGGRDVFAVKMNPTGSSLDYGTFLGGGDDDNSGGIAVDVNGVTYITGDTWSNDFPTTPGAFDTTINGGRDVFAVKMNPTGSSLDYGTFLGGVDPDVGYGIAVDISEAAYITGITYSSDFPTTPGAFDTTINGGRDVFAVKMNPTGSNLDYGTFLGGGNDDDSSGIAVDIGGAVYITGGTWSTDFPSTPGAFDTTFNGADQDAFVVKINPNGSSLDYGTFLGGGTWQFGWGIAVDISGAAYITGYTGSTDFPTTPGAFDTNINGHVDAFVVKLAMGGEPIVWVGDIHMRYRATRESDKNTIYQVLGRVPVFNQVGQPVPGARIFARWRLPNGKVLIRHAITRHNGVAYFRIFSSLEGRYTLAVLKVKASDYIYDPARNIETREWVWVQ